MHRETGYQVCVKDDRRVGCNGRRLYRDNYSIAVDREEIMQCTGERRKA